MTTRLQRKAQHIPSNIPSLIKGMYARVASSLGLDHSYVSRVARGHRRSEEVERALSGELKRILSLVQGNRSSNGKRHNSAKAKRAKKRSRRIGRAAISYARVARRRRVMPRSQQEGSFRHTRNGIVE